MNEFDRLKEHEQHKTKQKKFEALFNPYPPLKGIQTFEYCDLVPETWKIF